jgi:hypothetical protein
MLCRLQKEPMKVHNAEGVRKCLRAAPSAQAPTLIGCEFLKSEHP